MAEEELNERVYRACRMPKTRDELVRELEVIQRDVVLSLAALRDEGRIDEFVDGSQTKYKAKLRGVLPNGLG